MFCVIEEQAGVENIDLAGLQLSDFKSFVKLYNSVWAVGRSKAVEKHRGRTSVLRELMEKS